MAAKRWNLTKLFALAEATFNTDPSATGSTYRFLRASDVTFEPDAEIIERQGLNGSFTRAEHVVGAKAGTLSFKLELKGSGTPAVAAAVEAEAHYILEAALGSATKGTGSVVAAASTVSVVKVASTANIPVGSLLFFPTLAVFRFVVSKTATDLPLNADLPSVPATGAAIHASTVFRRADTGHKSMAFVAMRDDVQFTFLGGLPKVRVEGVSARGIATLSVDVMCASFARSTKGALPAALLAGVNAVKPPVALGAMLTWGGVATPAAGLDFDPGLEFAFAESVDAVDGKSDFGQTGANPAGAFRPYYNTTNLDDFLAGTSKALAFACGAAGTGWGLFIPRAQLGRPALEDRGGIIGENVPFFANDNGVDPDWTLCLL